MVSTTSVLYLDIVSFVKDARFSEQSCFKCTVLVQKISYWVCILRRERSGDREVGREVGREEGGREEGGGRETERREEGRWGEGSKGDGKEGRGEVRKGVGKMGERQRGRVQTKDDTKRPNDQMPLYQMVHRVMWFLLTFAKLAVKRTHSNISPIFFRNSSQ